MNTPNDPKGAAGAAKTPLGLIPPWAMEQAALAHKLGKEDDSDRECKCGRVLIDHFTLGIICEDCDIQWQDPY